jgi:hypothetical protein
MCSSFFVLMALLSFGGTEPAKPPVHKQNAQNFCSLAFALNAAGVNVTAETNHVSTILQFLVDGITITDREFEVPNLSEVHIIGTAKHVKMEYGDILLNGGLAP